MRVHLSVDDVIYAFMKLAESNPESIFDVSIFSVLKGLNEKYGMKFSLYGFENYAEKFFVNDVPAKYWQEMASTNFLRIGFHGTFFDSTDAEFCKKCKNFFSVMPEGLKSNRLRLHKYAANESRIEYLKDYGISELLCRENESRRRGKFPESYILTETEERDLDHGVIIKKDMIFRKTDIRLEFYDENELRNELLRLIDKKDKNDLEIIIFTHERFLLEGLVSFERVANVFSEYGVDYIF